MSNEIDNTKSTPSEACSGSVWRHFLEAIMMFESSPYFDGAHEHYEKRISSLEHEVEQLKSAIGQADVDIHN